MQQKQNGHEQAQIHAAYQCNLCLRSFPTNNGKTVHMYKKIS